MSKGKKTDSLESKIRKLFPRLDFIHEVADPFEEPLIQDVFLDKYAYRGESTPQEMFKRVAEGVYVGDKPEAKEQAYLAMCAGLLMPAGRILAGAGTDKQVTLQNCYVNGTLVDSMMGIMDGLRNTALTLQQGGGIGTDFSPLRPKRAKLKRTGHGAESSGPISFMHTWDALSQTIKSAGSRRGAMMGTICDTHPDLLDFIHAKREKGALEQFNVSVLISDKFIEALLADRTWKLYSTAEPNFERSQHLKDLDFDIEGRKHYVYSVHNARDIWRAILENTYEYSEPGVIFIDRVNELNNLWYAEDIRCTNPCGEQPLPPHGACNLASINLARLVSNPFMHNAKFDYDTLREVVRIAVRFLDNVIDVSHFPLSAQEQEQENKRRLGLGISGLADALAQMRIRYGDTEAIAITKQIMSAIRDEAYKTSIELAKVRGAFPLFEKDKYLKGQFIQTLPHEIQDDIRKYGIRNSHLLTIAPNGTISLIYGNISSGLEPIFAHSQKRRVFMPDNTFKEYGQVKGYAYRLFNAVVGKAEVDQLPEYMVTARQVSPTEHVKMQAACQEYIDASVSKTINLPAAISFEEFEAVYELAYATGCKGCTTYRPSDVRGYVLEEDKPEPTKAEEPAVPAPLPSDPVAEPVNSMSPKSRPRLLWGCTYKLRWPSWNASLYMTINHDEVTGEPFEIFLQSKDARYQEWMTAITLMISAILRRGGDVKFIPEELKQVHSTHDSAWIKGKFYPSLLSLIASTLEEHFDTLGLYDSHHPEEPRPLSGESIVVGEGAPVRGEVCPKCQAPAYVAEMGCKTCQSCGYSNCG